MTDTESESELEAERNILQKTISDVEAARAASTSGTRSFFESTLFGVRSRLVTVEKKIKETEIEKERQTTEVVAVAFAAQSEAALNERERETYSGFLKEDFFTKRDFGRLEEFYTHTWDRLSEHGKYEMSQRVWEGVRRNEYTFTELPEAVREKEAKRAYQVLKERETGIGKATNIPERDRSDFLRAYEAGKKDEAEKILDRESFKNGMFRNRESRAASHIAASDKREADSGTLFQEAKAGRNDRPTDEKSPEAVAAGQVNFASLNLGGMKAAESSAALSPPVVTNGPATNSRER